MKMLTGVVAARALGAVCFSTTRRPGEKPDPSGSGLPPPFLMRVK